MCKHTERLKRGNCAVSWLLSGRELRLRAVPPLRPAPAGRCLAFKFLQAVPPALHPLRPFVPPPSLLSAAAQQLQEQLQQGGGDAGGEAQGLAAALEASEAALAAASEAAGSAEGAEALRLQAQAAALLSGAQEAALSVQVTERGWDCCGRGWQLGRGRLARSATCAGDPKERKKERPTPVATPAAMQEPLRVLVIRHIVTGVGRERIVVRV
jgi:hypothetical protein